MKYSLGSILLTVALVGCNLYPSKTTVPEKIASNSPVNTQVIYFTGPMDLTIALKSSDNFETAEMTDNSDKVYYLKSVVVGSGVRMENEDGISIHFKNGDGFVELVKGKPISITEFKK